MGAGRFLVAVGESESDAPVQCIESAVPIALWQTAFKVYDESDRKQCEDAGTCDEEGEAPSGDAQKRNFAIGHEPIAGAYVVCVPVSDASASQSRAPDAGAVAYGRTNEVGWIVRKAREEVGEESDIPAAPWESGNLPPGWKLRASPPPVFKLKSPRVEPSTFYAHTGSVWRIFWTYSRAVFERFCAELATDMAYTLAEWEVPEYAIVPADPPRDHAGLGLLPTGSLRARYVDYFLFRGNERRYLDAFRKIHRARPPGDGREPTRTAAILNATPKSFWALYLCEWTQWYTERLIQDDPHWPYLWRLQAAIAAAESGAVFPDLEKALPAGGEMGGAARAMQEYLYACAAGGWRERRQIVTAVQVTVSQDAWRRAAKEIEEETGALHPALTDHNLDKYNFTGRQRDALIAYFDMYVLGFESAEDGRPLHAHWQHVQEALGWVRDKQAKLIGNISHVQLLRDLDIHLPRQAPAARVGLGQRFHYQCACLGVPFWEAEEVALQSEEAWNKLAPFLTWLGESTDLVALLFEKLLDHYVKVYQVGPRSVELLVQHLYRYHVKLRGGASEQTLPKQRAVLRLSYDPDSGRAVAQLWQGPKKRLLGEFELLTQVAAAGDHDPPHAVPRTRQQHKLLRRALRRGQLRSFVLAERELEVPHADALEGFGKRLAVAGVLLRASVAITSLVEQLKQKPPDGVSFDAYLAVAEETLQGVGPSASLAEYVLRKQGAAAADIAPHPFVRGAARLVRMGDLIEAGRNLAAGGQTLATLLAPERSTTDLAMYLSRGESVPAWLEGTKGLVQIATGSAGLMGSLALGMGTTAAALPLGTWVVLGSVAIATFDVIIYVKSGGTSPVDEFLRQVREARRQQFQLRQDGSIKLPDETPPETPAGARPVPHAKPTSRLAQHMGTLHALLNQHLGGVVPRRT
jgi:hypothetical protein